MKKTIIIGLVVLVIAAAAFMYQDLNKPEVFVPVHDFAKDDEKLYQLMRKDLQDYLVKIGQEYGASMDDIARDYYKSGAYTINGRISKAAAFAAAAVMVYPPKKRWYNQLITN